MLRALLKNVRYRQLVGVVAMLSLSLQSGFAAHSTPARESFNSAITEGLEKVTEFRGIREEAERLGLRVWLFGGTAAGFGHYVHWDLMRKDGDQRFSPERFDYDYTNIYRSTQDLDIVVDGEPDRAAQLQKFLENRFPFFQGSKTAWEVRTLTSKIGDKDRLLDNPDYLNQSNDSNSTGMIELTDPPRGESRIRDLKDWKSTDSAFAHDIRSGMITYYDSPLHESTSRFKNGNNPKILSVIRYLTKVAQYDLEPKSEDLVAIQKIVDDFSPSDVKSGYVKKWIDKNAKKLILNATDIEKSWNLIERLGLRKKLMAIDGSLEVGSLGWWLNREPLRSSPIGQGNGPTAKELGISELAHGTDDYAAYESITMSKKGEANFLISRAGCPGETAVCGDGVYTAEGRHGAKGNGFTPHLKLKPEAREGSDFKRVGTGILILNKSAIEVIPESLSVDPVQWFEMLASGKSFDRSDRGIVEKVRRRVSYKMYELSDAEDAAISQVIQKELSKSNPNPEIAKSWSTLPVPLKNLHLNPFQTFQSWRLARDLAISNSPEYQKFVKIFQESQDLASALSKAGRYAKGALSKKEKDHKLIQIWMALDHHYRIWSPEDWMDCLATFPSDEWELETATRGLDETLKKKITELSPAKKSKFAAHVQSLLEGKTYSERVASLWFDLDFSTSHPEVAQGFLAKHSDTQAVKFVAKGKPQPKVWQKMTGSMNKKELQEFRNTLYSRDRFGDSPEFSETKKALFVPILERAYELGAQNDFIESALYKLREPWTATWDGPLNGMIDLLEKNRDKTGLKNFAYYFGIFDEDQITHWEKEYERVIRIAGDLKASAALRVLAEKTFEVDRKHQRHWNRALRALIKTLQNNRDFSALEELAGKAFSGPLTLERIPDLHQFIDVCVELKADQALSTLARRLKAHQYSNERDGPLLEAEFRRLIRIARETQNREILEGLARNLKGRTFPADFYDDYFAAIDELKAVGALRILPSDYFNGYYKDNEVPDRRQFTRFLDLLAKFKDPEAAKTTFSRVLQNGTDVDHAAYREELIHATAMLLRWGASDVKREQAAYQAVMEKKLTLQHGRPFSKRFTEIFKQTDPAKALKLLSKEFPDADVSAQGCLVNQLKKKL